MVVLESIGDLIRSALPGRREEEKESRVIGAQFFVNRGQPLPEQAREVLQRREVPLERVVVVGDLLLVVVPKKGTVRLVLGRGKGANVDVSWKRSGLGLVQDRTVSRRHAAIETDFGGVQIVDLESKHGLRFQGRQPKRTRNLALDDEFRLGEKGPAFRYVGTETTVLKGSGQSARVRKLLRVE